MPEAPIGKHLYGMVKVGEKGQIVIPADARKTFCIKPGDSLLTLGSWTLEFPEQGLALLTEERALMILHQIQMAQQEAKQDEGR